jgi:hypothetical protein
MADLERPATPLTAKIGGIVVLVLLGWLLFGSALSVLRAAIALVGYVVVAFVAFNIGKVVGRKSNG